MSVMTESLIHPTAVVSHGAEIAPDVEIGPCAIIESDVIIGSGSRIDSCAKIASGARLGENVKVSHGAVIGTEPQDLKFGGEKSTVSIGSGTVIREYATVNRGTVDRGKTVIGKNCLLMAYSHVAHDCVIGDNVIFANSVTLAGHIDVGDFTIIGGLVAIHQFVKIGKHTMVGGGYRVPMDICPYALAAGYPLKITGVNVVGLRRRGFSTEAIREIQAAFKILFNSDLNTTQALEKIRQELEPTEEIQEILRFAEQSSRGLTK